MEYNELFEIGRRLYMRRKEIGLTQEEVAEKAGLHHVTISNIELGKRVPEFESFVYICRALNISADFILEGKSYQYTKYDDINRIAHKLERFSEDQRRAFENMLDSLGHTT